MNDNHDPRHHLVEALRLRRYGRKSAETIVNAAGQMCVFRVDDFGVWVIIEGDRQWEPSADVMEWQPLVELDDSCGPDPSAEPSLPFPFSANQLAAFLLDGAGVFVHETFGEWDDGPDEASLRRLGVQATKAKKALRGAYRAYRNASKNVDPMNPAIDADAKALRKRFRAANDEANLRECVGEVGIGDDEYSRRRARAKDAVEPLSVAVTEAELRATRQYEAWRNAMVNWLLTPPDDPADFDAGTYAAGAGTAADTAAAAGGAGAGTTAGELAGVSSVGAEAPAIEGGTNLLTRGATAPAYGSGVSSVAPQPAGSQPVPAQPQTHRTQGGRDGQLWPVIEQAQQMAGGSVRPREVWAQLERLAIQKLPPLEGANSGGIQYRDGRLKTFTFAALRARFSRRAKAR